MIIDAYKDGRGKYKLVVFTKKYGLEIFKIKGKKEMRRKKAAIKELYENLENYKAIPS